MARRPSSGTRQPWDEAEFTVADVYAMKAFSAGTANAEQQKRVYDWIVIDCSRTNQSGFVPGYPDALPFIEGRRDVGRQIKVLVEFSPEWTELKRRAEERKLQERKKERLK